jgi:hypothetical protein
VEAGGRPQKAWKVSGDVFKLGVLAWLVYSFEHSHSFIHLSIPILMRTNTAVPSMHSF